MPTHNLTVSQILDALHDTQSKIQQYVQVGKVVSEGDLLDVSNSLRATFEVCAHVEKDCETTGGMCVAYKLLITAPESAKFTAISEYLGDTRFCRSIVRGKIDEMNITQRNFENTALSDKDIEKLEHWGETLVHNTFLAWEPFFNSSRWGPSQHLAPDQLVPSRFQSIICNFVDMQLNLWPCIKIHLDKYMIKGKNIYPEPFWNDNYLQCVMELDPRMISFVVGIADLDINALARRGPVRRSDTSRKKSLRAGIPDSPLARRHFVSSSSQPWSLLEEILPNTTRAQRILINAGIDSVREMQNGRMLKQHSRVVRRFNARFNSIEEMLGDPFI